VPSLPLSTSARWRYAAKPDSWAKLLVPFVLGQAMGLGPALESPRGVSFHAVGLGLAFTVLDLLFIVFLNDWGDREVDALKRRMFPEGCSPKTIPDGILSARALLLAGLACGALALAIAALASVLLDRPLLLPAATVALALFVAYTLPPLRLNYRGGGELCEMLGVGVLLPWLNAYLQGGRVLPEGLWLLPGFAMLSLASAIASGLADERSDRLGGKTTVVTTIGNTLSRRAIEGLVIVGAVLWLASALVSLPIWLGGSAAITVLSEAIALRRASDAAQTDAFGPQRTYKAHLHRAIHHGALGAAALLVLFELL
jgi:1,4-dihydroxy-2-naphthoate octaprenyltransferase/chlorophyll synthase